MSPPSSVQDADTAEALCRKAQALVAQGDVDAAAPLLEAAASAGHPIALIEMARMSLYGVGMPADPERAVALLRQAEAGGNVAAGYLLALVAVGGRVLPRDPELDRRTHVAVQAGHVASMRAAAIHFGRSPHAEDQVLCLQLLRGAAGRGDALAAALFAERLLRGEGIPADPDVAAGVYAQLAASGVDRLPAVTALPPQHPPCPPRTLDLRDALANPRVDLRWQRPQVGVIDGLLSADECPLLIASARGRLRDSHALDPQTGLPVAMPLRTSRDASLDPVEEDLALRLVQLRIAAAAGFELCNAEHLTVLHYAPGQEYRPHRDYVPPGTIERNRPAAGNRARTICVYLNDVEEGGETEFPVLDVRIPPKAGRAVVFDNLQPNGQADPDSLHAGLPVRRGEKWLATLWLRQRPYRDY